jgi:uncharacterized protein YcbX
VARFAATDSLRDDERQARQALAGATLSELQRAVTDPLDGRRFRANLGAAFRLSKLRIPADPAVAVRELGNP